MKKMKQAFEGLRTRFTAFSPETDPTEQSALCQDDLIADLELHGESDRLLGRFTAEEVRAALSENGVIAQLATRGYYSPRVIIRSIDRYRQSVRLLSSLDAPEDDKHLLCDLRVFDSWLRTDSPVTGTPLEIDALVIDWLCFQDPNASFTPDRPRLPGQRFPGLGIMRPSMRAILGMAADVGKEAVVSIPEYYHNALLYRPEFRFFDPAVEGLFLSLEKFLAPLALADASGAVATGQIWDAAANSQFAWKPYEQILPLAPRIADYFRSPEYRRLVEQAENCNRFRWRTE